MSPLTKQLILGLLAWLASLVFAWAVNFSLYQPLPWINQSLIIFGGLLVFLALWGLVILLVRQLWVLALISLSSLALFYLYFPFDYYYLAISAILFITILVFSYPRARFEEKSRLRINLAAILSTSLKTLLMGLTLWITLSLYYAGGIPTEITIPEKYGEKLLELQIPGFSSNLTFDNLIYLLMVNQTELKKQNVQDLAKLIEEYKNRVEPQQFQQFRQQIIQQWHLDQLNIKGNETLKEIGLVNHLINNQIQSLIGKYRNFTKWVLVVAYFELIFWLGKIFYPLSLLITWGLYCLLIKIDFISLEKTQVEAEKIKI